MNTAAKVRAEKTLHPSRFCANPSCLWRVETRGGERPCPKHPAPTAAKVIDLMEALKQSLAATPQGT